MFQVMEIPGEIYRHGRYVVTGQDGFYKLPKETRESWRVINTETRKLASAEFYILEEAITHADSLVAMHRQHIFYK
jgi:hypothetical protein